MPHVLLMLELPVLLSPSPPHQARLSPRLPVAQLCAWTVMFMSVPLAGYQRLPAGDGSHVSAGAEEGWSVSVPRVLPGDSKNSAHWLAGSHVFLWLRS